MFARSIQTDPAGIALGWPRFYRGAWEADSNGLPDQAWPSATEGDRSGVKRLGLSDQVGIDGPSSSSTSDGESQGWNPRSYRDPSGAYLEGGSGHGEATRWLGMTEQARQGAASAVWDPGRRPACLGWRSSIRCSRGSTSRHSWIKIGVGLGWYYRGKYMLAEKGGQRWSRSTTFFSSSLHNQARVSSVLLCYRAREQFLSSGRVKWWCEGWYVSNVSIIFDAPCLFLHHLLSVSLHFMAILCIFQN
jgi:hypothetical protein